MRYAITAEPIEDRSLTVAAQKASVELQRLQSRDHQGAVGLRNSASPSVSPARIILVWLALTAASAGVLDRIAVTVGNDAITEGEVLEEIRITTFLNNEPPDLGPAARRAAAERLVDQYLIRHELASGGYAAPDAVQVDRLVEELVKTRFHGDRAAYERKL